MEIEEVLYQDLSVNEAAVLGIPGDYWVEEVHPPIVLTKGATITGQEIMEFCKSKLARYKAPKPVEFLAELPKAPRERY